MLRYRARRVKLFQLVENVPTNDGNRSLCRVNFCRRVKKNIRVGLKTSMVNNSILILRIGSGIIINEKDLLLERE